MNKIRLGQLLLCFGAGALLVTAFEPFGWWFISLFSLTLLFYLWQDADPGYSFCLGLAFGYGLFGAGVSWVYVSLNVYGGMPLWMGSIAVLLFAGILAVFIALTGYVAARLVPQGGVKRILILPPVWVSLEWLKSWIFTGFPWLELGYTQTPTWLFGLAPVGGVYLISFAVTVIASLLLITIVSPAKRWQSLSALVLIPAVCWWLNSLSWSTAAGDPLKIGVVQGNVPIERKWQAAYRDQVIARLSSVSHDLRKQQQAELIIWPETALPLYRQQIDDAFWRAITPPGAALLTGLADAPEPNKSYNAAVLYCDGEQHIYRKRHLVPFGEYIPFRFLTDWVLDYLQLPMTDFSSWQGIQQLRCGDSINIGLTICYEDAFGSELRHYAGDATLLVNISEDAWFGDSLAPHQRLQMAQMRARELARPLVRSANTGPSVVIDAHGEVQARTEQFVAQTLVRVVQPQQGETPYKRWGNWIVWLSLVVMMVCAVRLSPRFGN